MKFQDQKPGPFWWTENPRYLLYFIRELSGIVLGLLAFLAILILTCGIIIEPFAVKPSNIVQPLQILTFAGLIAALIHTVTWLYAMPKILPFRLTQLQQKIVFLFLLICWIAFSVLLFNLFYLSPANV